MASAKTIVAVALAALVALPASIWAQARDFPTLQGSNQRVGHNGDPVNSGPGRSFINWWRPRGLDRPQAHLLDNTDTTDPAYTGSFTGGPYDVNLNGRTIPGAGWAWPSLADEADFPLLLPRRARTAPTDFNNRFPSYYYTRTVASALDSQTQAVDPARLRVFEWRFQPTDPTPRLYAVNVWLPFGPTTIGGARTFTQRYWVYEVIYGNGQRYVDVVDTDLAGSGYFRLGDGGRENRVVFPWDGVNPIRVRLYNTIPRDSNGSLLENVGAGLPDNRFLVYADGVQLRPDFGNYVATPSSAGEGTPNILTTAILNETSFTIREGRPTTNLTGVVSQYQHDTGNMVWRYTPRTQSEAVLTVDNSRAGRSGPFVSSTASGNFQGVDYYEAPIGGPSITALATYVPTLDAGSYEVWAYVSGDRNGQQFGRATQVQIVEGTAVSTVTVDQGGQTGWVRIGTRRYTHSDAARLRVVVTNASTLPADVGKQAFADAVRFIGASDLSITSSPVNVTALIRKTPGGAPEPTRVTIVADERGRIHCLDALGNGNGATTVYWTYPSTPNPAVPSWTDPNHVAGLDGPNGIAEMPTGFNLTSALVQRINGEDVLFIGSTNGRVYSIDMAGRGDFNALTGVPGTTVRRWSFPNDYPSTVTPSALGAFRGSVAFAETAQGPTLFVPTTQGRLYALDAAGNPTDKVTTVRWAFPALNQPATGSIASTPTLAFGNVYFGTLRLNDNPGEFYALNQNNGNPIWNVPYPPATLPDGPFRGNVPPGLSAFVETGDWLANPTAVSGAMLDSVTGPGTGSAVDTVFAINSNRYVYSFNAYTGAVQWQTNELNAGANSGLIFTVQNVFNNSGVRQPFPTVVVPTSDGRFVGLFARTTNTNRAGTRRAWQYRALGGFTAGLANSNGYLYGNDDAGYFYAFSNERSTGGEDPPGDDDLVENDPLGALFRQAKLRFITRDAYNILRQPTASSMTYTQGQNPANVFTRTPRMAFDWGETIYLMVDDFPYITTDQDGNAVAPPTVNFNFAVDGSAVRVLSAEARRYREPPNAPTNLTDPAFRQNGYAIIQFPLQGGGANFLAPGDGEITVSLSSAALGTNGQQQNISLDPALSRATFGVANPVGVTMLNPDGTVQAATATLGTAASPGLPENLMNGSRDIPGSSLRHSLLGSTAGLVPHGTGKPALVAVFDRSLIATRTGRGLSNVRIQINDLAWQGGRPAVYKPFNNTLFPNFEDYPDQFPNVSLDYPDIRRERVGVISDPNGTSGDPIFAAEGVTLRQPMVNGVPISDSSVAGLLDTRTFQPVPFQLTIDVPRFQPANILRQTVPAAATPNHAGVFLDQGYMGRVNVGVQSGTGGGAQFGNITFGGSTPSAYRGFNLSGAVPPDEKVTVGTPSLDLGALATGTGYSPAAPATPGSLFSPWTGPYQGLFRPFRVFNEGNVNLLNLRLAKFAQVGANVFPWQFGSTGNESSAWLSGGLDMWSDIDRTFALANPNNSSNNAVILQKPRVDDASPTELKTNPVRRANVNLNVNEGQLIPGIEPASPRIAISVPVGFPSGKYAQLIRVVEDVDDDQALDLTVQNQPLEAFSDPTLELSFTVRESRLTNSFSPNTAPMIDDLVPVGTTPAFTYANLQPTALRDSFGNLAVAYVSNRPDFASPLPTGASLNDEWRIYIATLRGTNPAAGPYVLNDLNGFVPNTAGRWFRPITGPFPVAPDTIFPLATGETILPGTAKFGSPTFPVQGTFNPFTGVPFNSAYLAFVGEAQRDGTNGRSLVSRVFLSRVETGADGSATVTAPIALAGDDSTLKSKPSILQTGAGATVFYGEASGNASSISYTFYDGATSTPPVAIPFGSGFESVSSPSVVGRPYSGAANIGITVADMTFTGKLKNHPHVVTFFGQMVVDSTGRPDAARPWRLLPIQGLERLVAANDGTFRARGVAWNREFRPQLWLSQGTATRNILLNGTDLDGNVDGSADTRQFDQSTGLITYQTRLGGRVVFDPATGTVRFTAASPNRNSVLLLTYQPRFLRIAASSVASYSSPTMMFDARPAPSLAYWRNNIGDPAGNATATPVSRLIVTSNRAAAGAGQAARPFASTLRLGIRLPAPIHTQPNGNVTQLVVNGNTGSYQMDPANGMVYFTPVDEDRPVTITYTAIDVASGAPVAGVVVSGEVGFVVERTEEPIVIDQAINESTVSAFLDPLGASERRPGLIWLFWTSTRAGTSDVYFQTIAPRWSPIVIRP